MSKIFATLAAFTAAFAGVSALPSQYVDLESRATPSNFSLFAFGSDTGTEIGGFPVFYHEGLAYIADPAKVNYTTNYVVFSPNSSDTTQWIASPLGRSTDMTWAGSELYVPVGDGPVGFYQETQSVSNVTKVADIITTGFSFYGNTAMVSIDGELESLWYAVATEVEGLWTVGWNATGGGIADAELLALRQVKAPNVDYPKKQ